MTDEKKTIGGKHILRALSYALRSCPTGDAGSRLAHLVFHDQIGDGAGVVGADGERFHVGYLPREAVPGPFAATRDSCNRLRLALEFAQRMSKMSSTSFHAELAMVEENDGEVLQATISYGAKLPIMMDLTKCPVGYIPPSWSEPVPPDAPMREVEDAVEFRAGHMKEAQEWYRAWDQDHGTCALTWRGDGMARLDIVTGGELVCSAFIQPPTKPPAQLVLDEPLFAKLHPGRKVGQSILDLQLDGDGNPTPMSPPDEVTVDGHVFKMKGLSAEVIEDIVKHGPCVHSTRKETPCWQCTGDAVKESQKAARAARKKGAKPAVEPKQEESAS